MLVSCSDDDPTAGGDTDETAGTDAAPATTSAPSTTAAGSTSTAPTTGAPASTPAPAPTAPPTVPSARSAGCGTADPRGDSAPRATTTHDFSTSALDGTYIEQLPTDYDGSAPSPMVLNLHGYSSPAQFQHDVAAFADAPGGDSVIVVTPAVTRDIPRWEAAHGSADVAFLTELLDHVTTERCVDEARIYATGFSNGGFMSSVLACELADRIAAVAPVAGVVDPPDCDPERTVPVLTFHGTDDEFVAFGGGAGPAVESLPRPDDTASGDTGDDGGAGPQLGPIPETVAAWADRYGCTGPAREPVAADVRRIAYECNGVPTVEFYRIQGGGHAWPGSEGSAAIESVVGRTTFSIDASELILRFFEAHPLP